MPPQTSGNRTRIKAFESYNGGGIEPDVISAVVLGGRGLVFKTIAGVFLIGVMNNGPGLINMPIDMKQIAKGVIIIPAFAPAPGQPPR